jgi:cobalt-precorrin 5A hydrolase
MYAKGIAVVAITRIGVETSLRIKATLDNAGLNATIYAPKKYSQNGVCIFEEKLPVFFADTYHRFDALISVMATGITIRAVAPLLESKLTDPAVIGVDAKGKFVISLLSGHYGGANDLARTIAKGIGATPVITTASETTGKLSVDELARILHLTIQNPSSLVAVNAAIVNEERIVLVVMGDAYVPLEFVSCYEIKKTKTLAQTLEIINRYDAGIIVSPETLEVNESPKPTTVLNVRKIVVGLGARKDTSSDSMIKGVECALASAGLSLSQIASVATVDIKRTSQPIIDAVNRLGLPLEFLSVDVLRSLKHQDLSPDSVMVQEKIGVGGVCERAALIVAGKNSKLLLKKTKLNGVTVAIAEGE